MLKLNLIILIIGVILTCVGYSLEKAATLFIVSKSDDKDVTRNLIITSLLTILGVILISISLIFNL